MLDSPHNRSRARTPLRPRPAPPAGEYLGADHPLWRAEQAVWAAARQLAGLGVFLAAVAAAGHAHPVRVPVGIGIAGGAVLAARALVLVVLWRMELLAAIADGFEDVPLRSVRRVRRGLLRAARRTRIARSLDANVSWLVHRDPQLDGGCRALAPEDVAATERELREVLELLQRPEVKSARAVALCERLLSDGSGSALYDADVARLRVELRRVRFLLSA